MNVKSPKELNNLRIYPMRPPPTLLNRLNLCFMVFELQWSLLWRLVALHNWLNSCCTHGMLSEWQFGKLCGQLLSAFSLGRQSSIGCVQCIRWIQTGEISWVSEQICKVHVDVPETTSLQLSATFPWLGKSTFSSAHSAPNLFPCPELFPGKMIQMRTPNRSEHRIRSRKISTFLRL